MSTLKPTDHPHTYKVLNDAGVEVATVTFGKKTNAASRNEIVLDAFEKAVNGGEGTSLYRLAQRLRTHLNHKIQSEEQLSDRPQQKVEKALFEALNRYSNFFKDPKNKSRKRDPSLNQGKAKPRQAPHQTWQ